MDIKSSRAETFRKKMSQWVLRQMKKCVQMKTVEKGIELPSNVSELQAALNKFFTIMHEQNDDEVEGFEPTIQVRVERDRMMP